MSGISDSSFDTSRLRGRAQFYAGLDEEHVQAAAQFMVNAAGEIEYLQSEIRRLRAENAELRASYERVEKYAQDLLQERDFLAAMVPSK